MAADPNSSHQNVVVGEPAMMLAVALRGASRGVTRVLDMGAHVIGDVEGVAREWGDMVRTPTLEEAVVGRRRSDGAGGRVGRGRTVSGVRVANGEGIGDSSRPSVFSPGRRTGATCRGVGGAWVASAHVGASPSVVTRLVERRAYSRHLSRHFAHSGNSSRVATPVGICATSTSR